MSLNVSCLQVIMSCNLGCGGVAIHHSPQIVRRISGVFTASARTSWCSGCVWVLVWIERAKIFVNNFSYLFGYSCALHACCAGWCRREVARGWMLGLGCKFSPACTYSAWPEPDGVSHLQRFQQKDVLTRAGCINRVLRSTSR